MSRKLRITLAVLLTAISGAGSLHAQGNAQAALVRSLNNSLLQIHAQLQSVSGSQAASLRSQGDQVIAQRLAAFSALIQQDPAQALQLAFSNDLVATLKAAFPQSAASLESQGVFQGPVEYVIFDDPTLGNHRKDIRMTVAGAVLDIYLAQEPPGLVCGAILRVEGVRAGNRVAAANGNVTGSTVAAAGCTTTGAQNIAVLLVTFPGITPTVTPQQVYDVFFASSGRSVDGYWREVSYNKTTATGNVFGWYTLSTTYPCDQYSAMRTAAIAAADNDVFFPNYTRVAIVFPNPGGCGWAGLGTLGCSTLSSADGSFVASSAWMLANYFSSRDQGVKLSAHEEGHNLTLHHSSSRDFNNEPLGPLGAAGTLSEYGDVFSTMGLWNLGHYPSPHKVRLNWLTLGTSLTSSTNALQLETNGSFSLQPLEISPPGLQALKIRRGTGNNAWLWVEFRQPIGNYDSTLGSSTAQIFSGATIHYEDSTTGTHTHLLDFTPETTSWSDPALAVGKTWVDPYSNVSVHIASASSSALTLDVNYGPIPCVHSNPTVSLSSSSTTAQPGGNISYTMTVTNADTAGCPAGTFNLKSTQPAPPDVPTAWATAFSQGSLAITSLTITPGASATATMTKTVGSDTPVGTYTVNAIAENAADNAYSGSATAGATVAVPPTVTLSGINPSYPPRSTVSMTVTVLSGGNPAYPASVTFTLVKPNGTVTKTATTDPKGQAVWKYRLGPKDPSGPTNIYKASATATYNSLTGTSAEAQFTVQ